MRRAVPDVAYTTMGRAKPSTLTGRTNYHWRFTPFREAREAGKDVAEAAEVAGIPVETARAYEAERKQEEKARQLLARELRRAAAKAGTPS